jgi:ribosomal-protein-alanine N-acetyltransferase
MITTARLVIRPYVESDADAFYVLTQDAGFRRFPITNYEQESVDSARDWIRAARAVYAQSGGLGKYAVIERESGAMIGMGGLTPWQHEGEPMVDITYRLRESAWGQGLGLELARALIDHAFGPAGLDQVTATITPDNLASKKIAEKIGLRYDRHITLLGVATDLYRVDCSGQLRRSFDSPK